jgi:hypothetical protein
MYKTVVGAWLTNTEKNPMQVVSGAIGRETVHFEAPASELVEGEWTNFSDGSTLLMILIQ